VADILTADFGIDRESAVTAAEMAGGQVTRALKFADPERSTAVLSIIESLHTPSERMRIYDDFLAFLSKRREQLSEEAEQTIQSFGEELDSAIRTSLIDLRKSFVDRQYRELLVDCLGLLLSFYRDVFVLKETSVEDLVINRNRVDLIRRQATALSASAIAQNMAEIEKASEYCAHYVSEERLFLDLIMKLRN
jgi:hypothetical protein